MVHGYDGMPLEGVRFFPGYVFLSRAVDAILPGGQTTALLVVANLGTLLAMVLLYRLVILESADIGTARRAVWALALFPPAFVLVWAYSEGPFLAMVVGCLLLLRRERWWEAALLAAGAALCLLYTSPSPRDATLSRMPSSA